MDEFDWMDLVRCGRIEDVHNRQDDTEESRHPGRRAADKVVGPYGSWIQVRVVESGRRCVVGKGTNADGVEKLRLMPTCCFTWLGAGVIDVEE